MKRGNIPSASKISSTPIETPSGIRVSAVRIATCAGSKRFFRVVAATSSPWGKRSEKELAIFAELADLPGATVVNSAFGARETCRIDFDYLRADAAREKVAEILAKLAEIEARA